MSAQQVSECCVSGHIHSGTPKGVVEKIGGLDTYVTAPESGSKEKTILFITDIFGWDFPNARLLADEYAAAGFYVYVPDFFQNDSVPHDLLNNITPRDPDSLTMTEQATNAAKTAANLGPWFVRNREAVAKPLIDTFLATIRATPGTGKIGAVGFCWGGRYAILLGGKDEAVDAVVANHPSAVAIPAEIEALTRPTQINVGDKDAFLSTDSISQIKEVLASKSSLPSEVNVFPGAVHGFSVRGDTETESERKHKEEAGNNAIRWFQKYLS